MKEALIDSHAHLTSSQILPILDQVLSRAKAENISSIINICTDKKSLQEGLKLSEKEPWIFNAGATTPHDVEKEGEDFFPLFSEEAKQKKFVAVGETGLDYFYQHSAKKIQKNFLKRYLHLALCCHLPVIIHCRDAFDDLYAIADVEYTKAPAVLHCFTGTMKEAEEGLKRGWMISFSGIITFKKSEELRQIAREIPLSQLLIETDSPYLAPQKYRGKQNEPAYVRQTAECIAQVKQIPLEEVAKATSKNAKEFFHLPI